MLQTIENEPTALNEMTCHRWQWFLNHTQSPLENASSIGNSAVLTQHHCWLELRHLNTTTYPPPPPNKNNNNTHNRMKLYKFTNTECAQLFSGSATSFSASVLVPGSRYDLRHLDEIFSHKSYTQRPPMTTVAVASPFQLPHAYCCCM